jgi:hypothetical protein
MIIAFATIEFPDETKTGVLNQSEKRKRSASV